ncbi:flagellar assembly protein H [Kluyvera cryocrescens]|uniref:Flagellar assembly protein H n=1 Tax=Kluyvera cryocrescens TaxID=580 RepID=A0A485AJE5_KLUCR|nr:flagellar assembly protein H [Kluyvera cryocrescens]
MFKKRSLPLDKLTARRQGVVKPRLHKFPPLRKRWAASHEPVEDDAVAAPDPAEYQKQLQEGFSEGVNQGFAQGMEEGKEEGYQEGARLGFEDGMRKGLAEGKQQARQQFLDAAEPFEHITANVQRFLESYEQRRREELLQLVGESDAAGYSLRAVATPNAAAGVGGRGINQPAAAAGTDPRAAE